MSNPANDMGDLNQLAPSRMQLLQREYIASFPEKMDELESAASQLFAEELFNQKLYDSVRLKVHQLAGSSGSYGYSELYGIARETEAVIIRQLKDCSCSEVERVELRDQLHRLIGCMESLHQQSSTTVDEVATAYVEQFEDSSRDLAIFVISARHVESKLLVDMLEGRGFTVVAFPEVSSAAAMLDKAFPAAIIIDVNTSLDLNNAKKLKMAVQQSECEPGFILLSDRESFSLRAEAAEFGADAFFVTPVNPHNLSSALDVMLETTGQQRCRLLVIQKQRELDSALDQVVTTQDMDCLVVTEFEHLLVSMGNYKPDIILFGCGRDHGVLSIARVIRMHESYFNIPMLFLVDEGDDDFHLEALKAGADDCIVINHHFADYMRTLRQRIMRFRRSNNLIILDSLTGTLNREAFMMRLAEEISLAARRNETICLAMIDVDRFKQVNDANGHLVGDFVLRHISDYLGRRLRRSDIVGRYAGDEFLVLLPDTDLDSAYLVLDIIRKNLVAQSIRVNDIDVTISISLGLVAVRPDTETQAESLIVQADKRLYEAKVAGRNTLVAGIV